MLSGDILKQKIKGTKQRFSWYNNMISNREIQEINELPLMTADILDQHYYQAEVLEGLHLYQTSGTSGKARKRIVYSEQDELHYLQVKSKVYADFVQGDNLKRALADMGTGHAARTAIDVFTHLGFECMSISFELPVGEHITQLESFRPELLYTMPSLLEAILLHAPDPKKFGIKKVILVGEIASRAWQIRAASELGITPDSIMDTYGCIEVGTMAYYSHADGCYRLAENIRVEGIQPKDIDMEEQLQPDESILVVTSLCRDYFPAIRYVTYDVVRDLRERVIDGVPQMTFSAIVKRVGKELKHGEKISLYDIEEVVYRHIGDGRLRVQVQNNVLVVYIQSSTMFDEQIAVIEQELAQVIPEIGSMIRGGLIGGIQVIPVEHDGTMLSGTVKSKKLYYTQDE
ncbi:CoF synthetase [Paenibacillus sp. N1-5-1-14]|uniref:CoF synthetase n=1 Tax=Paenibacillus radicibacter TaxID=2972488 RepID=UPI002159A55F|nr:CoF synthetase [Paenibacillus radicibacter]MCR8642095.1 CoF synthetase [Paenibacillus radicibacter]